MERLGEGGKFENKLREELDLLATPNLESVGPWLSATYPLI